MTPDQQSRILTDLARYKGVPVAVVRLEYGLDPQPEHWADDSPERGSNRG